MKRMMLVVLAMLALSSCTVPSNPNQTVNVNISLGSSPSPSASPSPAAVDCQATSIIVTAEGGSSISAGAVTKLDATPQVSTGPISATCPVAAISWSLEANSAGCQLQGAITSYNPDLLCSQPGKVTVVANVSGVLNSGRATFSVQ